MDDPRLLVGYDRRDDAAVYDLGDGTALIATTDFFMPVVDDPETFGRIAAANALSDVYAMGGEPMVALAVLGWPYREIPPDVAGEVMAGARAACAEVGIAIGGGHSIENPEPVFGLAVMGRVRLEHLKRNGGARPGDLLYLTKPIGVGILTTAAKKGRLRPEHAGIAAQWMVRINRLGALLGPKPWVHAMTDVTGYGLLGHLAELCEASGVGAVIRYADIPRLVPEALDDYVRAGCSPGGAGNNHAGFSHTAGELPEVVWKVLYDPQTSGGLLVAVDPAHGADFEALAEAEGLGQLRPLGQLTSPQDPLIQVVVD